LVLALIALNVIAGPSRLNFAFTRSTMATASCLVPNGGFAVAADAAIARAAMFKVANVTLRMIVPRYRTSHPGHRR